MYIGIASTSIPILYPYLYKSIYINISVSLSNPNSFAANNYFPTS